MANYENSNDLKIEVLQHSGELTDGTSEHDSLVMTFLNRAYHAVLSGAADLGIDIGQPWAWAKTQYPSVLTITPAINAVPATLANGSTALTFATAPTLSYKNYYVQVVNDPQLYRIKSHAAGVTAAVIDSPYLGSGTSVSLKIMKFDYQLDGQILRLIGPFTCTRNISTNSDGKIELIDQTTFGRDYPMALRFGHPDRITEISKSNAMQPTVRFNRIPDYNEPPLRIEYDYIPVPDDLVDTTNSIPVVPRDHRVTLCYYAAYYLLMDKNDNRAAEYRELARAGMLAMVRANKVQKANTNQNYGRMIPRQDMLTGLPNRRYWSGGYDGDNS